MGGAWRKGQAYAREGWRNSLVLGWAPDLAALSRWKAEASPNLPRSFEEDSSGSRLSIIRAIVGCDRLWEVNGVKTASQDLGLLQIGRDTINNLMYYGGFGDFQDLASVLLVLCKLPHIRPSCRDSVMSLLDGRKWEICLHVDKFPSN